MKSSNYEVSNEIGKGAYATVYKGKDKKIEGRYVAMKEFTIPLDNDEGIPVNCLREIGLLKKLDKYAHPNIVRLLDVFFGARNYKEIKLILIFEHFNQDLSQYLHKSPSMLDSGLIKSLMYQILSGVDFVHSQRILHRDLKPQNILVSDAGVIKIADFGLAKIHSYRMSLTSVVVTLFYRSPEVLLHNLYGTPVDVWSCGCIFAELYTKKPLFQGFTEIDQMTTIFECIGVPDEDEWPSACISFRSSFKQNPNKSLEQLVPQADVHALDLLSKMLVNSQEKRISAKQALEHPYFSDVSIPPNQSSSSVSSSSSVEPASSQSCTQTTSPSYISSSPVPTAFISPLPPNVSPVSFPDKQALVDNSNILNKSNNTPHYLGKASFTSNTTTLSANSSPNQSHETDENDNILDDDNSQSYASTNDP